MRWRRIVSRTDDRVARPVATAEYRPAAGTIQDAICNAAQPHGQMLTCGCRFDELDDEEDDDDDDDHYDEDDDEDDDEDSPYGVDGNGLLTERRIIGGVEVIIHYNDVPESDLTTVDGIRCTNALRTFIDVACDMTPGDLVFSIRDALQRQLFTLADAHSRLAEPDMTDYRRAHLVNTAIAAIEGGRDE